jgi:hypothetical protein
LAHTSTPCSWGGKATALFNGSGGTEIAVRFTRRNVEQRPPHRVWCA